jgi:pseudaminic acid biosynthesis-associated methylase
MLQYLGFKKLYGIELQHYAVEKAKQLTKDINIIQANAIDIPFKNNYFEFVFTCGVLIHIPPEILGNVMDEMYRCSGKYILGLEYFAEQHTSLSYRGESNLMWKGDFGGMFMKRFPDLKKVKEKKYKYVDNDNVDIMYLLEKK